MKKYLICAIAALFATSAIALAVPSMEEMKAKETAAWQAFKDKDAAAFQKVVDHDVVGVYAEGIAGMTEEVAGMKAWDMKSFAISEFKGHSDEKDVFVTSYKVTLVGTLNGKDASATYNAGSVWKMENDAWLAIFHTNVKAEAGVGTDAQKKE